MDLYSFLAGLSEYLGEMRMSDSGMDVLVYQKPPLENPPGGTRPPRCDD